MRRKLLGFDCVNGSTKTKAKWVSILTYYCPISCKRGYWKFVSFWLVRWHTRSLAGSAFLHMNTDNVAVHSSALWLPDSSWASEVLPGSEWLSPTCSSLQGLPELAHHYVNSSGKDLRRLLLASFYVKSLAEQIFSVFDNVEAAVTRSGAPTKRMTSRKL